MTVTTLNVQKAYTGDNSTKIFAVDFQFWDSSELQIFKRIIATGVETLKVEATDYTVTGGAGLAGSIDFAPDADGAPADTEEVHVRRVSDLNQANDLSPSTVLPNAAIEESLDRSAMRDQEDRFDLLSRSLLIPKTDIPVSGTAPDMELPNKTARAVANAVLGFDATSGDPIVVTGATLPSVTVTAFGADLVDDADAATARATLATIHNSAGNMDKIAHVPLGADIQGASAFGDGIQTIGDTREIWHSDSITIRQLGMGRVGNASIPASAGVAGRMVLDTDNRNPYFDDGTNVLEWRPAFIRGALGGGTLTLSGSDQDINFGVCEARVGTSADRSLQNGYLDSAIIKQLDTVSGWVEGSNAAGRPAADSLAANKWHHCFIITKADGTIDAGFDDNINAANLIAAGEAGGETPPYVNFRYWGSVKETAAGDGTCHPFIQHGDNFVWTTLPGLSHTDAIDQAYNTQTNITLSFVPPDVRTLAHLVYVHSNSNRSLLLHGGTTISAIPAQLVSPLASLETSPADRDSAILLTDTSQQVVYRSDDNTSRLHVEVSGYENARGRWD